MLCDSRIFEFVPAGCTGGECSCVAQNTPGYKDCLKKQCENDWKSKHGFSLHGLIRPAG